MSKNRPLPSMNEEEQGVLFEELQLYKAVDDPRRYEIRNKIAEDTIRLVPFVEYEYKFSLRTGIPSEELYSYGYEGLLLAIDNYNPTLGYKFSTYAVSYIKNYIKRGIRDIRGFSDGKILYQDFIKCEYAVLEDYKKKYGRNVTIYDDDRIIDDIIALMLKEKMITTKKGDKLIRNKLSLIYHDSYEAQTGLISYNDVEGEVNLKLLREIIFELLETLPERQRDVIIRRYGLNGDESETLDAVGKNYGICQERVRQLEGKALRKLRRCKELRGYIN